MRHAPTSVLGTARGHRTRNLQANFKSWQALLQLLSYKTNCTMNPGVHIKFVDSDDEDMQVANPPAAPPPVPHVQPIMAHVQPASVEMRCSFTIRTDYGSQDQCYVFQLVPNAAGDLVAATLSNRVTKLYAVK